MWPAMHLYIMYALSSRSTSHLLKAYNLCPSYGMKHLFVCAYGVTESKSIIRTVASQFLLGMRD